MRDKHVLLHDFQWARHIVGCTIHIGTGKLLLIEDIEFVTSSYLLPNILNIDNHNRGPSIPGYASDVILYFEHTCQI